MAASTIPYIGSKISLVSNAEIRYEGILYTINTQESTIALQSVRSFGTEGRKLPEVPPSSEIYDFIIFRGQDIKDLTVLESKGGGPHNDPAVMSVNQKPSGPPPSKGGPPTFLQSSQQSSYGGKSAPQQSSWDSKGKGKAPSYGGKDKGGGSSWGWEQPSWGWGDSNKGKGKGKGDKGGYDKGGYDKGGKSSGKGKSDYGSKGKDGKGKSLVPADKGKGKGTSYSKGDGGKGKRRDEMGTPVGELVPDAAAPGKKEFEGEFDVSAANASFAKVTLDAADTVDEKAKPLAGYDKTSSFFDNISCEATERAGDVKRERVDREKAQEMDRVTFGDTRRPPRPMDRRRKGGKGGKWN